MFVDDNEDFRMVGQELLAMLGHTVECFASAELALADITAGRFDVLMTDVGVPGMSRLELAAQARVLDAELRIVLATGYGKLAGNTAPHDAHILTKQFTI